MISSKQLFSNKPVLFEMKFSCNYYTDITASLRLVVSQIQIMRSNVSIFVPGINQIAVEVSKKSILARMYLALFVFLSTLFFTPHIPDNTECQNKSPLITFTCKDVKYNFYETGMR